MTVWRRGRRTRNDNEEIASELASYVEERTAQGIAAGLDPEDAARRARVEVGGVAAMTQKLREQQLAAPVRWLGDLARDVRHAFRQAYRAPAVPLVAVLTLALGIGGAAAMFGLMNGMGGLGVLVLNILVGRIVDAGKAAQLPLAEVWLPVFDGVALGLFVGVICWLMVDATRSIVEQPNATKVLEQQP